METEVVLLRRFARTGDAEAFSEIIRRHAGLVYGAAWRILADMDRASDVAQETFLQLTKDAAKVTGSLPGWLHRVATHKAIDLVRRDSSRKHRETRYAACQPHEVRSWREISPHVDEGLNTLDAELREILVAHFLEGQSTRQIANVRGISQATVSRRLEAGVVALRGRLRRRGLLVAAGTLSVLLGERAVNAAPASLKMELGKMALAGGQAACASGGAANSTWSVLQSTLEGAWAGIKTKLVAAAAVAAVGFGTVATYQQIAGSSASRATEKETSTYGTVGPATIVRAGVSMATGNPPGAGPGATAAAEPVAVRNSAAVGQWGLGPERDQASIASGTNSLARTTTESLPAVVYPMDYLDEEATDHEARKAPVEGGSVPYASRAALVVPGPNDANDPNDPNDESSSERRGQPG